MNADDIARAMWERTHDGSWEDRGDGQDASRDIYLADAEIAFSEFVAPLREQFVKARAAFVRIDAINDNPARFDKEIDDLCRPFLIDEIRGEQK